MYSIHTLETWLVNDALQQSSSSSWLGSLKPFLKSSSREEKGVAAVKYQRLSLISSVCVWMCGWFFPGDGKAISCRHPPNKIHITPSKIYDTNSLAHNQIKRSWFDYEPSSLLLLLCFIHKAFGVHCFHHFPLCFLLSKNFYDSGVPSW